MGLDGFSLYAVINELNNSKLLNIESKEEISITFENFNWFGKIKTKIKNFIEN